MLSSRQQISESLFLNVIEGYWNITICRSKKFKKQINK